MRVREPDCSPAIGSSIDWSSNWNGENHAVKMLPSVLPITFVPIILEFG